MNFINCQISSGALTLNKIRVFKKVGIRIFFFKYLLLFMEKMSIHFLFVATECFYVIQNISHDIKIQINELYESKNITVKQNKINIRS